MKEITAEIRNKLQRAKTALEKVSTGEPVSIRMADSALADLEKVVKILAKLKDEKIKEIQKILLILCGFYSTKRSYDLTDSPALKGSPGL